MKKWIKVLLITLIIGVPAFFLGPIIWTPHPDVKPTPTQLPFFMLLSVIESLTLGLGISFLIFGWSFVKKSNPQLKNKAIAMYVSLGWLLVSWWPHDNWHIHNGLDEQGLLYIDYSFHVTIIIASLVLAYCVLYMFKEKSK